MQYGRVSDGRGFLMAQGAHSAWHLPVHSNNTQCATLLTYHQSQEQS